MLLGKEKNNAQKQDKMTKNKFEICECGHNRCEHIPICCFDGECKCKKYRRVKFKQHNRTRR